MNGEDTRPVDAEIQGFLAGYSAEVQAVVLELRELVMSAAPGAMEQLDLPARMLAYGYHRTYKDMICVIMPYKGWVNLGFPRGVDLPDPDGLLAGTGKRARHVRISSEQEVEAAAIRALLEASIAQLAVS